MTVSVVIPTRGDVDLGVILQSHRGWEVVVYDNGAGRVTKYNNGSSLLRWYARIEADGVPDLAVYARYAAIEYASNDLILTQDDDCIVSDPQKIVRDLVDETEVAGECVVCNMPREFRHDFYVDHALVGFGAAFYRGAPQRAFDRFLTPATFTGPDAEDIFDRTCDIVFTALTPRVLVDVPKENLPYADDDNRMWRQPTHQAERAAMLELVRKVRDG